MSTPDNEPYVEWNGDGTYTPRCDACSWQGKARWVHADALSAARSHGISKRHRERANA